MSESIKDSGGQGRDAP